MRIGNWEVWKDLTSEIRYEFATSNGVAIHLHERFDDDSGIGLNDRACVRDGDSPTGWRYLDNDEPMDEFDFQSIDVSQSLWYAEAYLDDELVEVSNGREQPDAQGQLLEWLSSVEDPDIAAAGREALADWNARRPDRAGRPRDFGRGTLVDPSMRGYPLEWE